MDEVRPLIVIAGPTAAGKSNLGVEVAMALGGEVVSADAFQVYRGMQIGTAKVGAAVRKRVPHHALDLVAPAERFSAGQYARAARQAVEAIRRRGLQPVVVGGSGLYLRALLRGLAPLPRRSRRWRQALEAVEARRGLGGIYRMVQVLDPGWAARVGPRDRQRMLRGLEVTLRTGEPMSRALERYGGNEPAYPAVWVGIDWPRELLRERIAARVDGMLEAGWVEEVRGLLAAGVPPDAPGFRAIGYRELVAHLAGEVSLEAARQRIVRRTRQYAKRQLTWFRNQTPATWFVRESASPEAREVLHRRVLAHLRARLPWYTDSVAAAPSEVG